MKRGHVQSSQLAHVPALILEYPRGAASQLYGRAVDARAVADGLNALPGFRTSAAFFSFLRQNLVLPHATTASTMSSLSSSPVLKPTPGSSITPSPLSNSRTPSSDPASTEDEIPELKTHVPTDRDERADGIQLIADSVAQQRQSQSFALIFHPIFITIWITQASILYQYIGRGSATKPSNYPNFVLTTVGGTMIMLALVRMLGAGFLNAAEDINWGFLQSGKDSDNGNTKGTEPAADEDILITTRFGAETIGALVLRIEGDRKQGSTKLKNASGLIRAWTVKLRYRRKGVGTALLEEAIRVLRERAGKDAKVGFAVQHANSHRILPDVMGVNKHFRVQEERAIKMLAEVEKGISKR